MKTHDQTRADRAEQTLRHFYALSGYTPEQVNEEGLDTVTVDLLGDLRHFCAAVGIDFENCARIAENHFTEEVSELNDPELNEQDE